MLRLKRHLVLQLVAGQGPFWKLVDEARRRCGITPKTQLPPADLYSRGIMRHPHEVHRIRDEAIPEAYYRVFTFDWLGFIYACLLYQPPRLQMEEFANFGPGPFPYTFVAPGRSAAESPRMVAPPIEEVWGADSRLRYKIVVDEHTTEEDVRKAYWRIASARKESPKGGRPGRDLFVAVHCAILHDEANPPDPADRRRRPWTYDRLAKKFELESARAAEDHVRLGRAVLKGNVSLQ